MTNMNGTGSVVDFNVKPKRISRTTYGITGKVKLNDDDLKNYEVSLLTIALREIRASHVGFRVN